MLSIIDIIDWLPRVGKYSTSCLCDTSNCEMRDSLPRGV